MSQNLFMIRVLDVGPYYYHNRIIVLEHREATSILLPLSFVKFKWPGMPLGFIFLEKTFKV